MCVCVCVCVCECVCVCLLDKSCLRIHVVQILLNFRREVLQIWKQRHGDRATYSHLMQTFQHARCQEYADKVKHIGLMTSSSDSSSSGIQEVNQPPTYPKHKTHSVSHLPATPKPTEAYMILRESPTTGIKQCESEVYDY